MPILRPRYIFPVVLGLLALAIACRSGQAPQIASTPSTQAAPAGGFTGTVAETMDAGGYTYARLQKSGADDVWIAAPAFATQRGELLNVALEMPMKDFESKTLNRTFPLIYFVSSVSRDGKVIAGGEAAASGDAAAAAHGAAAGQAPAGTPTVVAPVAPPAGGISIADLWKQRKALTGKEVTVRGQVVKANNGILGKNWIHLQDGSGDAKDRTNDITITTDAVVKVGDVVTITGTLATGRDIGGGYAYDAIIENARVR